MPYFQKKPVVIEAHQWFKNGDYPLDDVDNNSSEGKIVRYFRHPDVPDELICDQCNNSMFMHGFIDTLENGHRVCPGDWIITGIKGERYPCKPDIFAATYEPERTRLPAEPLPVPD